MNTTDPLRPEGAGDLISTSVWFELSQDLFTAFEELTLSNDPLHTDADWVVEHTHYTSTIAPGFLNLSLLPYLAETAKLVDPGWVGINYGFNRVRWIAPVPVGSKVRARFYDGGRKPRPEGQGGGFIVTFATALEIEGADVPGMHAEWLVAVLPDARPGGA